MTDRPRHRGPESRPQSFHVEQFIITWLMQVSRGHVALWTTGRSLRYRPLLALAEEPAHLRWSEAGELAILGFMAARAGAILETPLRASGRETVAVQPQGAARKPPSRAGGARTQQARRG